MACRPALPPGTASLPPTLALRDVQGGTVAFQSGRPVPTFSFQPRPRLDLDGRWAIDLADLDTALSLNDRRQTLSRIEAEAAGRLQTNFDDQHWKRISVPGAWNSPPAGLLAPSGAFYRTHFVLPPAWQDQLVTLKFASVNYIADIWINGHHAGYHEGGSTPFAFDVTRWLLPPGEDNLLAVRVDLPVLGQRQDIVPWGLTDWWNYGGITGPVWLEASSSTYVARTDVFPHLDAADVSTVVYNAGPEDASLAVRVELLPAEITSATLGNPDPRSLLAPRLPIASALVPIGVVGAGRAARVNTSFGVIEADLWSPAAPALYVVRAAVQSSSGGPELDQVYETFGMRTITVQPRHPRLLLNGSLISFSGVAVHDEQVTPATNQGPRGGPLNDTRSYLAMLGRAAAAGADLLRADHHPPNPLLLMLADRLGFAVWEEIPLYHYMPETFDIALGRGVPQQMLSEMVLRDMNHPSVLFHGLANESTGGEQRASALSQLRDLDRQLDGTRLTGQAMYGFDPADATSNPLDVAGYTFYYGVFYGDSLGAATEKALAQAHAAYPTKPLMILEFGRWSDSRGQDAQQKRVFTETYQALQRHADTGSGGYVGAAVWWALDDYWTMRPGIQVEHFGLYHADGSTRPVGLAATELFGRASGNGPRLHIISHGHGIPRQPLPSSLILVTALAYAVGVSMLILVVILLLLTGATAWQRRPAPANR